MDIRSFFSPKSSGKTSTAKSKKDESDEDDDFERKVPAKETNQKKKKKAVMIESDSDEEPLPPKIRKDLKKSDPPKPVETTKAKRLSDVSPDAFFGATKSKKPEAPEPKKEVKVKEEPKKVKEEPKKEAKVKEEPKKETKAKDESKKEAKVKEEPKNEAKMKEEPSASGHPKKTKRQSDEGGEPAGQPKPKKQRTASKTSVVFEPKPAATATSPDPKPRLGSQHSASSVKTPTKTPSHDAAGRTPEKTPTKTPEQLKKSTSFKAFLQREGPRSLGSKQWPDAPAGCLSGLTIVMTGVIDSFDRDMVKEKLEEYGAKVTQSVSKKTSYVVIGRDPGQSKVEKAQQFGTKMLDEDQLLALIEEKAKATAKKGEKPSSQEAKGKSKKDAKTNGEPLKSADNKQHAGKKGDENPKLKVTQSSDEVKVKHVKKEEVKAERAPAKEATPRDDSAGLLWVDKYKPTSVKQIIGQQGDSSIANKLINWLNKWHEWHGGGKKAPWGTRPDGLNLKAALLSGPPGIGKTTTAQLVCQECDYAFVELNASVTRNKKNVDEMIKDITAGNSTVDRFFKHDKPGSSATPDKLCLIMDEVDGMSGNEDRGGIQELIQLIKRSTIPIICICNDRYHPRVRSLANHCFDLRVSRPRLPAIKAAMMSVLFKEGVKIPPQSLEDVINGSNHDIRQVLHNLSVWSSAEKSLNADQVKKDVKSAEKDLTISPFDACRALFVDEKSYDARSDLFFTDYSIMPLFFQDNYLHVTPKAAQSDPQKHLRIVSRTADSFADSDRVSRIIRQENNWSLLPVQACYSAVIPGFLMHGYFAAQVQFPVWLGKNSSSNKTERILQDLQLHMRLHTGATKREINMYYAPFLRDRLTRPLLEEDATQGVQDVIDFLTTYDLTKEDLDSIMEVSQWPDRKNPMDRVPSKVKAAVTRAYNKEAHLTPYTLGSKKKQPKATEEELLEGEEVREEGPLPEQDEADDDDDDDAMIVKKKKKPAAAAAKESKKTAKKEDAKPSKKRAQKDEDKPSKKPPAKRSKKE